MTRRAFQDCARRRPDTPPHLRIVRRADNVNGAGSRYGRFGRSGERRPKNVASFKLNSKLEARAGSGLVPRGSCDDACATRGEAVKQRHKIVRRTDRNVGDVGRRTPHKNIDVVIAWNVGHLKMRKTRGRPARSCTWRSTQIGCASACRRNVGDCRRSDCNRKQPPPRRASTLRNMRTEIRG